MKKKKVNNLKEKKGISPLIATVLLIAIALTLALAIFMWAKTWVGEKIEKDIGGGPQAIEMFCEDVSFEARVKGDGEVTITNIGNIPIYNVEVKKIRNLINSTKVNYPHLVSSDLQTGKFEVNKIFLSSVISKFSQINLGLILVKSPRREDDSIILLVTNTIPLIGIKFLPDVWIATSEHVRKPHFLEKISTSKFLPTVYYSKIDKLFETLGFHQIRKRWQSKAVADMTTFTSKIENDEPKQSGTQIYSDINNIQKEYFLINTYEQLDNTITELENHH